jgi:hypothetical protein
VGTVVSNRFLSISVIPRRVQIALFRSADIACPEIDIGCSKIDIPWRNLVILWRKQIRYGVEFKPHATRCGKKEVANALSGTLPLQA